MAFSRQWSYAWSITDLMAPVMFILYSNICSVSRIVTAYVNNFSVISFSILCWAKDTELAVTVLSGTNCRDERSSSHTCDGQKQHLAIYTTMYVALGLA